MNDVTRKKKIIFDAISIFLICLLVPLYFIPVFKQYHVCDDSWVHWSLIRFVSEFALILILISILDGAIYILLAAIDLFFSPKSEGFSKALKIFFIIFVALYASAFFIGFCEFPSKKLR